MNYWKEQERAKGARGAQRGPAPKPKPKPKPQPQPMAHFEVMQEPVKTFGVIKNSRKRRP